MGRNLAERTIEPRHEPRFVTRLWSRQQRAAHRGGVTDLPVIQLGAPSPLLSRLVHAPLELAPAAPERRPTRGVR